MMMDVLGQITKQRERRGWTEYLLAEKAELPQSTISSWYKKQMLPSLSSLEKICNAFDMTMAQFFAGTEEAFPLSDEQQELLVKWACLQNQQKELLLQLIQTM
ncbi:helix-turn-helix transcriptional regulator [Chakrabartyella piscis]|uniref:helix-turn-helix domain-containing protein n=1 Tax=Chakrabartyella piscis TaxID=2918914 RepID=UPI002958774E|nr:helix-turn-helix transcriptional regulator [Chakrabartyella piscis]